MGVTQFPERGSSQREVRHTVSIAVLRISRDIEDLPAEDQMAGQAPGGVPGDAVDGPLARLGEQGTHLQPTGDDGIELIPSPT